MVGGGIVGLAVARQLLLERPGSVVDCYEKEPAVGTHQTGHNSGVLHAGLYYAPGSLKARLCRRGGALLREFAAEHSGAGHWSWGKWWSLVTPARCPPRAHRR